MKLGAPSDAAVRLREKRHEREGTSPRAPSPRAVDARRASGDQVPPPFVSNPVHNMSVDSLAVRQCPGYFSASRGLTAMSAQDNKVPTGPEEEAEGLSRQLSEVGRAASNQDSGDDVARGSPGAGDKPTLRSSFKKQRSVRLAKAGGLSELLTGMPRWTSSVVMVDSGRWTRPG